MSNFIRPPQNEQEVITWRERISSLVSGTRSFFALLADTAKFGDVANGNYSEFGTDGSLEFNGNATVYEDLQVSISNVRLPTANAPTWVMYDFGIASGVTFPVLGFALNEYFFFDIQSRHAMKLSSILGDHFHYSLPDTTDVGDNFKFQLDVIAAPYNGQWAVPTGSPFTKETAVAANDDTYHRILDVADIPGVNTTVSTLYKCKLTRIAATSNEYGSDVYVLFNDCHYEKDAVGSLTEYTK